MKRESFRSRLGFLLVSAGCAIGIGNVWRFPYVTGKNGGGYFVLFYILCLLVMGVPVLTMELAVGRASRKSAILSYKTLEKPGAKWHIHGWFCLIGCYLLMMYYTTVSGWMVSYFYRFLTGKFYAGMPAEDASAVFGELLSNPTEMGGLAVAIVIIGFIVCSRGLQKGLERVSKVMMPILVVLSLVIGVYSVTRPGALEGVKYFLIPNPKNFSWMTVVAAMGQMFYSLSIAMGILITFGSYMKKDVSIEGSTRNVEIFDTAIAIMAGLMIIPAVFAFSGGDPDALKAGPSLMFITIPKVFDSMGLGTAIGIAFFLLVLFAALTSSIALTESAVSTLQDELGWSRNKSTAIMGVSMVALGSLSSLGYGPLANVTILGMQFLDFFDFLTNSVMMPIAAIASCILVSRVIGVDRIAEEVTLNGGTFRRRKIFNVMIRFLCPFFAAIILISSIANAFGWISM